MIHPVAAMASASGGGGGGGSYTVTFTPNGGAFSYPKNVTIAITGGSRFRWKFNSGVWHTVEATSGTGVATGAGPLYVDILDGSSNVLYSATSHDFDVP